MQYDFLKNFPIRMKNVGLYAILVQNSIQKTTWKQYGFLKFDEQLNVIFSIMLYIMEQSLKDEGCTIDDIAVYIDNLNMTYLEKNMSYEDCQNLADFIVNVILSNEGKVMYFDGYDFDKKAYTKMNISYIANKVIYIDEDYKRTSYYLTDDGYSLLLSTFEVEHNLKITIHEMIFQMHLEKQSYDKAVDDIKNIFNMLRIQLQKMKEAMNRIRRNALNYSVKDYEQILIENLETISDTRQKFNDYRELVKFRVHELEEKNINIEKLSETEEENLNYLKIIENYLNRTIDEYQQILNTHFDLKALYTKELESLSQMSLIKRFSFSTDFYDMVLKNADAVTRLDYFLRPLFNNEIEKIYNINKAVQYQKVSPFDGKDADGTEEVFEFDEDTWREEQEKIRKKKLKRYKKSLGTILSFADKGEISLQQISDASKADETVKDTLIPNVDIFKEIMVELMKSKEIDIAALKKEKSEFIQDTPNGFELNDMILNLVEQEKENQNIVRIETYKSEDGDIITFDNVLNEDGERKTIRCSNVVIRVIRE